MNRNAYLPPKPKKRKAKVESDSSDEEWLPGVDEETAFDDKKKFKPGELLFKCSNTENDYKKMTLYLCFHLFI